MTIFRATHKQATSVANFHRGSGSRSGRGARSLGNALVSMVFQIAVTIFGAAQKLATSAAKVVRTGVGLGAAD